MMSGSTKRIQASILRSGGYEERRGFSNHTSEAVAARHRDATEDGQKSDGFSPVGSARRERMRDRFETLLHIKGLAGGVPQNTERTTVKPWVGIAR
jgi:hypothetical protein